MKTALISGGLGFIGSFIARKLVEDNIVEDNVIEDNVNVNVTKYNNIFSL